MTAPDWQDGKRYLWPLGLLVPLIPFGAWLGVFLTGSPVFWWVGPILVFFVFPLVDTIVGQDTENPPEAEIPGLEADRYYRWCVYLYLPVQYVSLVLACWLWTRPELGVVDRIGLAVSVGCVSGIAINTAHELGHKRENVERWLSRIALAQTGYGHFYVEHNRGHHVRVATPEDPASSRLGESFWAFLPRSVVGSARSAWKLEFARLRRGGGNPWTWRNDVLTSWAMTLVLFAALLAVFGPGIWPYLLLQAVFGFSLLEVVNYLEHYGLSRQRETTGRYEKVRPSHSWNSNQVPSNLLLFHLQRHSDHHTYPTRRYQSLRHFDEAPQLPSGYPLMIVLAWVTPLWRRVMDPRVLAHYGGDLSRTNRGPQ